MPNEQTITICSVGDLMICDSPLYASVGVGSKYPRIREALFRGCRPLFERADVVIGNFETVVHTPENRSLKETQMCCPASVVSDLKAAGFSILNLANNHCMQHGTAGFQRTKETCEAAGIAPIGVRDEEPFLREIRGSRLAFLSLCIHLEWYEPDHILYEDRIGRILERVRSLRAQDDALVIVVSAHWGDEFAMYPSNAQIALAHKLVECGANVILGHHSHVYQGVEEYRGAVIVYGQGNFVSDMIPALCRQTGAAEVTLRREENGWAASCAVHPFWIQDDYVLAPSDADWFAQRQEALETALRGERTDADYWSDIRRNHGRAHGAFKQYFQHSLGQYSPRVSSRMIWEFLGRKLERIIGTSSDGQVSSMDAAILEALQH